ncbi:MAG: transcriptional regulator [Massilia sp.]|nr:transcriptional regulator [Massilia sp.]
MEQQPAPAFQAVARQSHDPHARHPCQGPLWSTLREICALLHIPSVSPVSDKVLFPHVRFRAGQPIHGIGQAFDTLYAVNSGFLKTATVDASGHERVLGFPMRGDMLGMDAIHMREHASGTQALSECDLILVSFARLNSLSRATPDIERLMYHVMSRELARRESVIGMLGTLSAEARVAHFLIALSDRFAGMGYSGKIFHLRMTRQEIGNYLGLTLETVSRTLSAFDDMGLITVRQRVIGIRDAKALDALRRMPPSHAHARQARARRPAQAEQDQALRKSSTALLPKRGASR